ncbi:MAG: glycosyltransferase [Proteobacteria bacterium]|nr:glycosyltransferase [Pseudomonadota bacterium]
MSDIRNSSTSLVSIVMPTYNQANFIGKAISSVMTQTHTNWELIVVNNFSSDDTEATVREFNDSRIKFINFSNHGVIASSRNHAIKLATGQFIAFLDSDDYWEPRKLEVCLSALSKDFDLVCHAEYFFYDSDSQLVPHYYGPTSRCAYSNLLKHGNCLSTSAIVIKRDFLSKIGLFNERREFITAEDFDLWIRAAEAGAKINITNEILGYYRLHANSASASVKKLADATIAVLKVHKRSNRIGFLDTMLINLRILRIKFFVFRSTFSTPG